MRLAVFHYNPIQYYAPLWRELAATPGIDLHVFYYARQGVSAGREADFGVKVQWDVDMLAGYSHTFLPRRWPTRDPLDRSWKGLNSGISTALDQGFDAVWIAGYSHLNNWTVVRECRRRGIPVVCAADSNVQTRLGRNPAKRILKRLVIRQFAKGVEAFLPASDHGRAYFRSFGVMDKQLSVVPFAIDTERFQSTAASMTPSKRSELRQRFRIPAGAPVITMSGKLIPRKCPLDVVAALAQLQNQEAVLLLIGDGPLRTEIEALRNPRVIITGFVNQREIPEVLALGDVLVLASNEEPYGLAVTESLAVGVPCIVSDSCGCYGPSGVLRHGENGLVFATGNVVELAQQIDLILGDADLRSRMSARGREIVEQHSPRRVVERLIEVISKVSDRRQAV